MTAWEYRWRTTYWSEVGRDNAGYITRVKYEHFWKPDLKGEVMYFPDDRGFEYFGAEGWELIAVLPHSVTLITVISPQGNDGYGTFSSYTLIFKRPIGWRRTSSM